MPTLYEVVNHSYDEFLSVYDAPEGADASSIADDLLLRSLANNDVAARIAIAGRLLDDGADPAAEEGGATTLHVLLGRGVHDFEAEAPLLKRLLDGGADINKVIERFGTPLETLAAQFKFSDDALAPFYDVLFARADLDLQRTSLHDRSVYANVEKWAQLRSALIARMDQHSGAR